MPLIKAIDRYLRQQGHVNKTLLKQFGVYEYRKRVDSSLSFILNMAYLVKSMTNLPFRLLFSFLTS